MSEVIEKLNHLRQLYQDPGCHPGLLAAYAVKLEDLYKRVEELEKRQTPRSSSVSAPQWLILFVLVIIFIKISI